MRREYEILFATAVGVTIILAMGTGAYFGSLYAPDKKNYTVDAAPDNGSNYNGPSDSLSDISGLPNVVERVIANRRPATGTDHEKRDLAAQESMSVWAFWMMVVAAFSATITTIGTILLYRQITLTRQAVNDTGESTRAMRRDQRAWLKPSFTGGEQGDIFLAEQDKLFWNTNFTITNLGRSPATNIHVSKIRILSGPPPVDMLRAEIDSAISAEAHLKDNFADEARVLFPGEPVSVPLIIDQPRDEYGGYGQWIFGYLLYKTYGADGWCSSPFIWQHTINVQDDGTTTLGGRETDLFSIAPT